MDEPTEREWLAWAAGIIDGEGCISLRPQYGRHRRDHQFYLCVDVTNTDLRMLDHLKRLFGGSIRRCKPIPNRRPIWQWSLSSAQAGEALNNLLPFLVTKHNQAELGLLSRRYMRRKGARRQSIDEANALEWLDRQLKTLKRAPSADIPLLPIHPTKPENQDDLF